MVWDNRSEQELECPHGHLGRGVLKFNNGDPVWLCAVELTRAERGAIVRHPFEVVDDIEDCSVVIRYADYDENRNRWT